MFNKFKKTFTVGLALAIATAISFTACKKSDDAPTTNTDTGEIKYGALMMVGAWPNTTYYIAGLSSLKEGTIDLKGKGVNMSAIAQDQGFIQRNGYYYYYNGDNGRLGRYHIANDLLVTDREVPFTQMSGFSSHIWADDNTLVVFGTNTDQTKIRYAIINATTLASTGGEINTTAPTDAAYTRIGVGFAEYRSGKIFIGYGYLHANWPTPSYPKVLVAAVNYPSMTVSTLLEDSKSRWPGGPTRYNPYSFVDENGDLYFATVPEGGWDYDGASLIYRIKSGTEVLDNTYNFDYSAKAGGNTVQAMWYIGNGQAIVRGRIPADRSNADFYYNWDSNFALINVQTGAVVKKFDLPTDKGQIYVQAVIVEDGKAYLLVNGANSNGAIWEYDPATDKLTKGATFGAGYDILLRLDKWK
ncbi:hypothetical protein IM792_18425 [Mucilaginibacter sp. JRF]|uniref:hypothetical protein n=1 Tax=Mucilaginibacter sp. JRF TaxID=2780088 RepID=UPI001882AA73|nr:hypothetical protein [Mucilaginibacter sp. JRF]MBE9586435.1 hypothetical protein [Mucilaginibacter sp. JRF]